VTGDERGDDPDEGGTYTLVLAREASGTVTVGALGTVDLPAGAYAYVGSALGTGGFARVDRHRRVAAGDHDTRHWHVDYLTGDADTRLVDVVTSAGVDAECRIADGVRRRLTSEGETGVGQSDGPPVVPLAGFGASDCDCRAHLFGHPSAERLASVVRRVHRTVGE
jgi:endonuclease-3